MQRTTLSVSALALSLILTPPASAAASAAREDDKRAALADVPAPAVEAVQWMFPVGKVLDEAGVDVEDGKKTYEIKLMNQGEPYEVEVDGQGAVTEIEGEVDPLNLPRAVKEAVRNRHRESAITSAREHVEVDGPREVKVFKLVVLVAGRPVEFEIRPDGAIEDEDQDKGDDQDDDKDQDKDD